jgi:hypothetical protein
VDDFIHVLAFVIMVPLLALGLVIAAVSPFANYRHLASPERRAQGLLRAWLVATAKAELVAMGVFTAALAIGAWMLLPWDSLIRHALTWASLVAGFILAGAAPFLIHNRLARRTPRRGMMPLWLLEIVMIEALAVGWILGDIVALLPTGAPLSRTLSVIYPPLLIASVIMWLIRVIRDERVRSGQPASE